MPSLSANKKLVIRSMGQRPDGGPAVAAHTTADIIHGSKIQGFLVAVFAVAMQNRKAIVVQTITKVRLLRILSYLH